MSKTNWSKIETGIWKVVLFKENARGEQKFYEYDGDHSFIAEQMYDVEDKYLRELEDENG
tara:strand:+ start:1065 stop:1244 length:180 start_codon:yes stop_codon:yes gene_type:complete